MILLRLLKKYCPILFAFTELLFPNEKCDGMEEPIINVAWRVIKDFPKQHVHPDKLRITLYTRERPYGVEITDQSIQELDTKRETKIIIPGYAEPQSMDLKNSWINDMKNTYLSYTKHNIIVINWEEYAYVPYTFAPSIVKQIGIILGQYVLRWVALVDDLSLDEFHFVGFSLGAHISAFAGKYVYKTRGEKIYRITGLETGGPVFEYLPETERLNKNDAQYVDGYHTNGLIFLGMGISKSYGSIDVFIKGGKLQPECLKFRKLASSLMNCLTFKVYIGCSHTKTFRLWIESIKDDNAIIAHNSKGEGLAFGEHWSLHGKGDYFMKN